MNTNRECFGSIFPDIEKLTINRENRGKVFSVKLVSLGVGINSREIHPDIEQWKVCRQCEEFDSCYSFSQAKLILFNSLKGH
jgi:hypothetical protein